MPRRVTGVSGAELGGSDWIIADSLILVARAGSLDIARREHVADPAL
jgi:hypothetical protein